MEYLFILLFFLFVTLFMEHRYRIHLYNSRKERIIVTLLFLIIGILWDTFAVYRRHWIFPGNGLIGVYIGNLPIEEYLFFLIMPYAAITYYKVLDKILK